MDQCLHKLTEASLELLPGWTWGCQGIDPRVLKMVYTKNKKITRFLKVQGLEVKTLMKFKSYISYMKM